MKKDLELISLVVSKELHEQLKEEAENQEISVSALVRRILGAYLKAKKDKKPDQLN